VFGPPGISDNIWGLIRGVHWDRIGDRGPRFFISELHADRLLRFHVQAGRSECVLLDERPTMAGLLLDETEFRVRAETLDHGTPVLAFCFEPSQQVNVRKERLAARNLPAGPWLAELKRHLCKGELDRTLYLPNGDHQSVETLAEDLVLTAPGQKLAYATDLADTRENRTRLIALAEGVHTFFCEAAFAEADSEQAHNTQHLTARACGEIGTQAGVERLVPFHFSRRYEKEPERIYREVQTACERVVLPP
jgi:ribonuclease BN (tRNA processing enzyme)